MSNVMLFGEDHSHLLVITAGVIGWVGLYAIMKKLVFSSQGPEFSSRVVAAIHAMIVTPMAYMCYKEGPNPFDGGAGEANTDLQVLTMEISLSYFLYDFGWCVYYGTEPFIMLVHHICSIASIGTVIMKGVSGAEAVIGLGSMEASNPYLQLRWFLRTYGYNNTPMHTFSEWYFIVLFLALRLGVGTKLTYSIFQSPAVSLGVKTCAVLLYIISVGFVYYILLFIRKKYFRRSDKSLVDNEKDL